MKNQGRAFFPLLRHNPFHHAFLKSNNAREGKSTVIIVISVYNHFFLSFPHKAVHDVFRYSDFILAGHIPVQRGMHDPPLQFSSQKSFRKIHDMPQTAMAQHWRNHRIGQDRFLCKRTVAGMVSLHPVIRCLQVFVHITRERHAVQLIPFSDRSQHGRILPDKLQHLIRYILAVKIFLFPVQFLKMIHFIILMFLEKYIQVPNFQKFFTRPDRL